MKRRDFLSYTAAGAVGIAVSDIALSGVFKTQKKKIDQITVHTYILKFSDTPDRNGNIISKDCDISFSDLVTIRSGSDPNTLRNIEGVVKNHITDDIGIRSDITLFSDAAIKVAKIASMGIGVVGMIIDVSDRQYNKELDEDRKPGEYERVIERKIHKIKIDGISISPNVGDPDLELIPPNMWTVPAEMWRYI